MHRLEDAGAHLVGNALTADERAGEVDFDVEVEAGVRQKLAPAIAFLDADCLADYFNSCYQPLHGIWGLGEALKKLKPTADKKLSVKQLAFAMETVSFNTSMGEVAMRKEDHQVLLPLVQQRKGCIIRSR